MKILYIYSGETGALLKEIPSDSENEVTRELAKGNAVEIWLDGKELSNYLANTYRTDSDGFAMPYIHSK